MSTARRAVATIALVGGVATGCASGAELREQQAHELRRLCSAILLLTPDGAPSDEPPVELPLRSFRLDDARNRLLNATYLIASRC